MEFCLKKKQLLQQQMDEGEKMTKLQVGECLRIDTQGRCYLKYCGMPHPDIFSVCLSKRVTGFGLEMYLDNAQLCFNAKTTRFLKLPELGEIGLEIIAVDSEKIEFDQRKL